MEFLNGITAPLKHSSIFGSAALTFFTLVRSQSMKALIRYYFFITQVQTAECDFTAVSYMPFPDICLNSSFHLFCVGTLQCLCAQRQHLSAASACQKVNMPRQEIYFIREIVGGARISTHVKLSAFFRLHTF